VDAEFVVALGSADTSGLGELPPNVRIAAGWIPLNALLQTSSALVHHGGAGSTLGALAAGLPQLVLPSGADRYINATAVHDGGAGLSAEEDELDAVLLDQIVGDGKLRKVAGEVSAEIAALPSPAQIVSQIAGLV
jgi:UDP:flavonoid glycosyltransferase YjiC (YdhE family)